MLVEVTEGVKRACVKKVVKKKSGEWKSLVWRERERRKWHILAGKQLRALGMVVEELECSAATEERWGGERCECRPGKRTKKREAAEINVEESLPPPPDFSEVCVEIDQFISDLSSAKCQEYDPPDVPKVVEQFAFLMEAKIANYDLTESPMKWNQLSDEDSSSFLEAVDQVSKLTISLTAFSSESKYNSSINRIGCILQRAMSYLEDEFKSLLESLKIPDSPSSHSNQTDDQSASQESNATGERTTIF
ncbi:exocyst subunit exo70 family protein C2 [Actinidia rufa]|uniref:Exocyst subunit exo70 family protein C2 n=1 Tax=Actinidia rufa TaxID=165716 RepID=A0A7J0DG59_9ERIC|nr:exocyst subunit exo70 family protein C2 [Actinidia rufa]